jgi:autotransporter-associated beta strand protein
MQSLLIKIDTFDNGGPTKAIEPNGNHIEISYNGDGSTTQGWLTTVSPTFDLSNDQWQKLTLQLNRTPTGATLNMSVVSGGTTYPLVTALAVPNFVFDTSYYLRLGATTGAAYSLHDVDNVSLASFAPPTAPISVTGTPGNAQVSLAWTAPTSNGNATITDYVIQYKTTAASTWSTFSDGTSTATSATVTGLTNGTGYVFQVAAVNSVGSGAYSAASGTITPVAPVTVPGFPTGVTGTAGNAQVSLSWTAPSSNGGAAITDYVIQYKTTTASTWSTFSDGTSTATSATVTGLTNGTGYVFQVAAVNSAGTGAYSSSTGAVTPATTPGAPTTVIGTAGNTQVSLSWTAPVSNGGAVITDYVVRCSSNGGASWMTFNDGTSSATSATVTGLTNGTGYIFQVAAVNGAGTGAYSAFSPVVTPILKVAFDLMAGQVVSDSTLRSGSVQLLKTGPGTLVLTKANSHSGGTVVEAGNLIVRNSSALGVGQLVVRSGATVTLDMPGADVGMGSLWLEDGGRIDVGYGRLSIPSGAYSLSQISELLKRGYGATWVESSGIGTSKSGMQLGGAVGYMIDGGGSITVGYAVAGDSNLDGTVDVLDVSLMLATGKFNTGESATWADGDFNYDGVMDVLDIADLLAPRLFNAGPYVPASASSQSTGNSLSAIDAVFLAFGAEAQTSITGSTKKLKFGFV